MAKRSAWETVKLQGEQIVGGHLLRRGCVLQLHPLEMTPVFWTALASSVIDENAPHGGGCSTEEVAGISPLAVFFPRETQPGFMDKRGGLEGLTTLFSGELLGGQLAQFLVDRWKQPVDSPAIPFFNSH